MAQRDTFTIPCNTFTPKLSRQSTKPTKYSSHNYQSQHSDTLTTNTEEISLCAHYAMVYPIQTLLRTMRRQSLEDARERIRTACAERNYFSPVFQLVRYE